METKVEREYVILFDKCNIEERCNALVRDDSNIICKL